MANTFGGQSLPGGVEQRSSRGLQVASYTSLYTVQSETGAACWGCSKSYHLGGRVEGAPVEHGDEVLEYGMGGRGGA